LYRCGSTKGLDFGRGALSDALLEQKFLDERPPLRVIHRLRGGSDWLYEFHTIVGWKCRGIAFFEGRKARHGILHNMQND